MKKSIFLLPLIFLFLVSCFNPNECELTESFSPSITKFPLDKGHQKYKYEVTLLQHAEIYTGDCDPGKNINETRVKVKSLAPCDQILDLTINVDLGTDSYTVERDSLAIQPQETVDLGVVHYGGPRIDFASIEVIIFTALCPGDE